MKKLKLVLICMAIFLLSGCSADYNLVINKNLSVDETGIGTYPNSFYESYIYSSFDNTLNMIVYPNMTEFQLNAYSYAKYKTDIAAGVKFYKRYSSVEAYAKNSFVYNQYFEKLNYTEYNDIITLSTSGTFYLYCEEDPNRVPIEAGKVSITVPYKVTTHNADSCVDTNSTTTCIWKYDKATVNKMITLSFNKSKLISNEDRIFFFVILGIGVIILIGILKFMTTVSSRNKF